MTTMVVVQVPVDCLLDDFFDSYVCCRRAMFFGVSISFWTVFCPGSDLLRLLGALGHFAPSRAFERNVNIHHPQNRCGGGGCVVDCWHICCLWSSCWSCCWSSCWNGGGKKNNDGKRPDLNFGKCPCGGIAAAAAAAAAAVEAGGHGPLALLLRNPTVATMGRIEISPFGRGHVARNDGGTSTGAAVVGGGVGGGVGGHGDETIETVLGQRIPSKVKKKKKK